jgi:Raf kinase inhibitor-like YbhB/YbcL family protein
MNRRLIIGVAALAASLAAACSSSNGTTVVDASRGGSTGADAAAGTGGSDAAGGTGGTVDATVDGVAIGTSFDGGGPAARLDDGQVLGVMIEANSGEAGAGQVATTRASAAVVKAFAQRMVDEHSAANRHLTAELMELGVTPSDSPTRRELGMAAAAATAMLWAAPMASFDETYARSQVEMHSQVLTLIDNVLLPSATGTLLRAEVAGMRTSVVSHLEGARNLLAARGDGGVTDGSPSDVATGDTGAAMAMLLASPTLADGGKFPPAHAAPANESPELRWANAPSTTRSFAVTLTDLSNGLVHWVVWDIPPSATRLPASLPPTAMTLPEPAGAKQKDFMLEPGYLGPNPGPEYHTYRFDVWPLDVATLPMAEGKITADLLTIIKKHTTLPTSVGSLTAQGKTLGN